MKGNMDNQAIEWNKIFEKHLDKVPKYDNWLDKYSDILQLSKGVPIIDLGCGFGNDTLYLHERGYEVISCDFSAEALKIIERHIPNPNMRLFNMFDGLPFENESAKVIISDLSLHYFHWADTIRIIDDIFRVLCNDGYLLCRVNSVRDENYGAGQGEMLEENYFNVNGKYKRFFNKAQLEALFSKWEIKHIEEYEMNRYKDKKIVWETAVKRF